MTKAVHNERKKAIGELAARKALELPIQPSGFWFQSDIRDNFYYAIHLFAYAVDSEVSTDWSNEQRAAAQKIASTIISNVLSLQVQNSEHPMYGHWPLKLGNEPAAAKPHPLPVELMGCLLIYFYDKYQHVLPIELKSDCSIAILHIYQSDVYRQPLQQVNHHEAKHTSLKLLLGHQFDDRELIELGLQYAKLQLQHIKRFGFKEYGALPWHWHWIQSFTCVWEVVKEPAVRETMSELLDYLWRFRMDYYMKGSWVGAQSRQWPHDAPKDNNTLLDYIQFGDFPLPCEITRLEGAALYTYQVADYIVKGAIERNEPVEIKRKIRFALADGVVTEEAHTYAYITSDYAVGGIWERRDEFDNEQQRWDITLPLTETPTENGVNQTFFFHPGVKYVPGDDRHASPYGEVLFHKDSIIQMWALPEGDKEAHPNLIGCLPKGEWKFDKKSGYGRVGNIYLSFHLMNEYGIEEKTDRISITSAFLSNWHGVMMEAISCGEAAELGIHDLDSYAAVMNKKIESLFVKVTPANGAKAAITATYSTHRNDTLCLTIDTVGGCERLFNDQEIIFDNYRIY
jgi:hypothetical protein